MTTQDRDRGEDVARSRSGQNLTKCGEISMPNSEKDSAALTAVSDEKSSLSSSGACVRCNGPRNRTAASARFCLDCMVTQHQERRRVSHAKQHKGSREQYERMLALWRDGTLRRVLEAVE
jgi:hypothetical protein